jgi:nucleotide-binding universal stress UspA family protein
VSKQGLPNLAAAVEDFRRARRRAALERILAPLTGRSTSLLSYDDVRQKLKARETAKQELENVPLDAIVGSVGRYTDFTRSFLPKKDSDEARWARVMTAVTDFKGVPPIELYRIGDAYFVRDGNHRVSVARELGATHIHAFVTEVQTKVPLAPDDEPDDIILKAEYADFLERTQLDVTRPKAELTVTVPGQYQILEEHIRVHRHFIGLEWQREIPYEEAAAHWYDWVYLSVIRLIREQNILRDFPSRTEADLYLWIAERRAALEETFGLEIALVAAVEDLASQFSPRPQRVAARVGERIRDALTPDGLESGPAAGKWRRDRVEPRPEDRLFHDILVGFDGGEGDWHALNQALEIARREEGHVSGLHVIPDASGIDSEDVQELQAKFEWHCGEAGLPARLAVEAGAVPRVICDRSRWADLVVLSLTHPPSPQLLAKLGSGLGTLIRRCPRPILTVPGEPSPLDRPLLAYDGSPKADEALFVAAYLAGRWHTRLTVVLAVENGLDVEAAQARARDYLATHRIDAEFVEVQASPVNAILETAAERDINLIVMGGYGASPLVEIVLGSTLDEVLRTVRCPVLICR